MSLYNEKGLLYSQMSYLWTKGWNQELPFPPICTTPLMTNHCPLIASGPIVSWVDGISMQMYKMFSWIFIFGHNAKVLSHFRCRSPLKIKILSILLAGSESSVLDFTSQGIQRIEAIPNAWPATVIYDRNAVAKIENLDQYRETLQQVRIWESDYVGYKRGFLWPWDI